LLGGEEGGTSTSLAMLAGGVLNFLFDIAGRAHKIQELVALRENHSVGQARFHRWDGPTQTTGTDVCSEVISRDVAFKKVLTAVRHLFVSDPDTTCS
jgi:hypothetical protein